MYTNKDIKALKNEIIELKKINKKVVSNLVLVVTNFEIINDRLVKVESNTDVHKLAEQLAFYQSKNSLKGGY